MGLVGHLRGGILRPRWESAQLRHSKPALLPTGAEVRRAAESLVGALRGGAAQRPLWLGEHSMPGEIALGMILWEYQVHRWDLARATGQEWSPPVAAVEESLAFAPAMLTPDYQGEGKAFAPPVVIPGSSSALHHPLGLSGRDPEWTAP